MTAAALRTADEVERQLWDATANQRRLQAELNSLRAAEELRQVEAICASVRDNPDPHAVLGMVEELVMTAQDPVGAALRVINTYFIATEPED